MILVITIAVMLMLGLQYVGMIFHLRYAWKDYSRPERGTCPKVSVLVAARNEEDDLPRLLQSFENLDYPQAQIEILIADDQSEDLTPVLLESWCAGHANREFVTVQSSESGKFHQNGKANALELLSHRATGDYYFFTDADCAANPQWIWEGVSCFTEKVGIVLGVTAVRGQGVRERLQRLEWWLTLAYVKVASDLRIPSTGLGNNMVISREAYEEAGGFAKLPFTLTEDLEISRAICAKGYQLVHQVSPFMLLQTKAEASLQKLLEQRKRWMAGVVTLPWYWQAVLGLQVLYFPALIYLTLTLPGLGLALAAFKMLAQAVFLLRFSAKAGGRINALEACFFDLYNFPVVLLTILYYFWPGQIKWKSRKY
ncbi:glycosyltransferase [Algoriphagus halophytocola]|uniref:Glycosyltransferase n=1 Tax=Algoriphagus halophytocola TaxID=2991499 RepID=A0ABY6MLF8_9BACT|nr:glycosyltransferase [Algoriphagus sp. TR-M5]UZD24593.1 glycosyltransferase [Algoriphagus sp. TR-M5]